MPAETINIRQEAESGQQYVVRRRITKAGYLSSGYLHFPPGCAGLVDVRIWLEIQGTEVTICPIPDLDLSTQEYVAIDAFTLPFPIDREIGQDDLIVVEIRNGDADNDHNITVLVYWHDKKPSVDADGIADAQRIVREGMADAQRIVREGIADAQKIVLEVVSHVVITEKDEPRRRRFIELRDDIRKWIQNRGDLAFP